ncbi:unnamed protein product [Ambrosiozyma monospora]|uniref:Unnamed protein product n=1 Tax=Ambrosiozyma monospora TaxID=43982 RepID=A0ACB5T7G5_AMBMO|nr:unnamed protein product [Ambrosiozyma monospora]
MVVHEFVFHPLKKSGKNNGPGKGKAARHSVSGPSSGSGSLGYGYMYRLGYGYGGSDGYSSLSLGSNSGSGSARVVSPSSYSAGASGVTAGGFFSRYGSSVTGSSPALIHTGGTANSAGNAGASSISSSVPVTALAYDVKKVMNRSSMNSAAKLNLDFDFGHRSSGSGVSGNASTSVVSPNRASARLSTDFKKNPSAVQASGSGSSGVVNTVSSTMPSISIVSPTSLSLPKSSSNNIHNNNGPRSVSSTSQTSQTSQTSHNSATNINAVKLQAMINNSSINSSNKSVKSPPVSVISTATNNSNNSDSGVSPVAGATRLPGGSVLLPDLKKTNSDIFSIDDIAMSGPNSIAGELPLLNFSSASFVGASSGTGSMSGGSVGGGSGLASGSSVKFELSSVERESVPAAMEAAICESFASPSNSVSNTSGPHPSSVSSSKLVSLAPFGSSASTKMTSTKVPSPPVVSSSSHRRLNKKASAPLLGSSSAPVVRKVKSSYSMKHNSDSHSGSRPSSFTAAPTSVVRKVKSFTYKKSSDSEPKKTPKQQQDETINELCIDPAVLYLIKHNNSVELWESLPSSSSSSKLKSKGKGNSKPEKVEKKEAEHVVQKKSSRGSVSSSYHEHLLKKKSSGVSVLSNNGNNKPTLNVDTKSSVSGSVSRLSGGQSHFNRQCRPWCR